MIADILPCKQRGLGIEKLRVGSHRHGIGAYSETGGYISRQLYLSSSRTDKPHFSHGVVADDRTLTFAETCPCIKSVFGHRRGDLFGQRIWCQPLCQAKSVRRLSISGDLMMDESRQTESGIFVKTLHQRHAESIVHSPIFGLVMCGAGSQIGIFPEFLIVGAIVAKHVIHISESERPCKRGHRHKPALHHCRVGIGACKSSIMRQFHLPIKSELVTVVNEKILASYTGMGGGQICRNVLCVYFCGPALYLCRIGYIQIIDNAAVFFIQRIELIECGLHLISVAHIRSVDSPCQIFHGLVGIRAFGVYIVDMSTDLCPFIYITGKNTFQTVLCLFPAATGAVAKQSHGPASIIKDLAVSIREIRIQRIPEKKLAHHRTHKIYHIQSLGTEISGYRRCFAELHARHRLCGKIKHQRINCGGDTRSKWHFHPPRVSWFYHPFVRRNLPACV
ncbi:hypothetical protein IMSAGC006_01528 [Muribaculaceae bacterium]|nr:hypothetical protein IMSAGC006_01528 [Muribaculaceae bacterium]